MPQLDDRWQALRVGSEPTVLAQSAVAVAHTGNTTETTLATITVPAGSIGLNGQVVVECQFGITGTTGTKTARIKLGGTSFTAFSIAASNLSAATRTRIANRNNASSQVSSAQVSAGSGSTSGAASTGTVDTSADQTVTITGQLATATDTITLESYLVQVFPAA